MIACLKVEVRNYVQYALPNVLNMISYGSLLPFIYIYFACLKYIIYLVSADVLFIEFTCL